MPTYEKKPTQIEALQFTGGAGSASDIAHGAAEFGTSVKWIPEHSEFGLENGVIVENVLPEVLKLEDTHGATGEAQVGDWITVDTNQDVRILTNAEFTQIYQLI